ncbi:MAG: response regulator [Planctomycetota bacterium]
MNLGELTPAHFARALEIYLRLAHPGGPPPRLRIPDLRSAHDAQSALARFEDETRAAGNRARRYVLRLGNARYPFMKLVVHEHLLAGEFTFAVDTHDEMEVKPTYPDYDAWVRLRDFNRELKERIEEAWNREGIPTAVSLRAACLQAEARSPVGERRLVLVVDDQPDLAEGTAALLRAEGYAVEVAGSGEEALEGIDRVRPDLVLLDYEMPGMDGLRVLEELRARPATREVPVLLASAAALPYDEFRRADGFLVKPFDREDLRRFVARLLERGSPSDWPPPAL